jgi:hypothetical protein
MAEEPGPSARQLRFRAVDFNLTDEQRDFVAAIRDFCRRGMIIAETLGL